MSPRKNAEPSAPDESPLYFTLPEAEAFYGPGVFPMRLQRRLIAQRRIAFSKSGRRLILARRDVEAYFAEGRQEPIARRGPYRRRP